MALSAAGANQFPRASLFPKTNLTDHFVIAGGGRVGRYVATVLHQMNIPFVIVEYNSMLVDELKTSGFPLLFGDAEKEIILEAADVGTAKMLLITTPVAIISRAIVAQAKKLNPISISLPGPKVSKICRDCTMGAFLMSCSRHLRQVWNSPARRSFILTFPKIR